MANPMKLIGAAAALGLIGGVASTLVNPSSTTAAHSPGEDWKPRNTISRESLMSAADLDRQQPDTPGPARPSTQRHAVSGSGWSYRNCREARAAGAAPLYRGQPGYGPHMDGDNDGIACEPYHGR